MILSFSNLLFFDEKNKKRDDFVSTLHPTLQQIIWGCIESLKAYDNQDRAANYFLQRMNQNKNYGNFYRLMGIDTEIKNYIQTLLEQGKNDKAANFIGALLNRKEHLPSGCMNDLIELHPQLKSVEDICSYVDVVCRGSDGKYLSNIDIGRIQKLCADKILHKYEDPKDHIINESNRTAILTEMSTVNKRLEGRPYLDFADLMLKNDKNMPTMPLIRNDDVFSYIEASKSTEGRKPEDIRATLDEIYSIKRPSFPINSLTPENRAKLLDILAQDDVIRTNANGEVVEISQNGIDNIVEQYFGIKQDSPEYSELVSNLAQINCQKNQSGETPVFIRIQQRTNSSKFDLSSRFSVEVARAELREMATSESTQDPDIYKQQLFQLEEELKQLQLQQNQEELVNKNETSLEEV